MSNLSKQRREVQLELLEKLRKQLEDEESLVALNEIENTLVEKKYGLLWEEHEERVDAEMKTKIPVFSEITEREILNAEQEDFNFLLEGDNLHSLYLLNKTHREKIDVIYIDPPYNTGNKDFKYNDEFIVKDDGFKHSKWLSFMGKRLHLARQLLSQNGVIFISIDDHEYSHLKLLCDEIFGDRNFISSFIWQRKTGASDANGIATITEYILVYAKSSDRSQWKELFTVNEESFDVKRYKRSDEYETERGPYYPDNLDRGGLQYSDSMNFGIECPDGTMAYPNGRSTFDNDGWTWKWGYNKVKWGVENGFIEFERSTNKASGWAVKYKNYLYVDNEGKLLDRGAPHKNLITGILNGEGTKETNQVVGTKKFNNPKPLRLIKYFLSIIRDKNVTILDFFAGSGTTGQAVLELNKEDGGNRRFILCTNNENDICDNVTYPRIKNTIKGYVYSGKKEDILFEKKLTQRDLKQMNKIYEDIDNLKELYASEYIKLKTSFKAGTLKLVGEMKKDGTTTPVPANLKYYRTNYVDRYINKDFYISELLMNHIKEMIQLEFHIKVDQEIYILLKDDDDKQLILGEEECLNHCTKIFKPSYIFFTTKELKLIRELDIDVITIPDYYFAEELRKVGEL